ncbi:MFS transporter [Paraburkholderia xenovorans]|uniref:MFS transporter n=1 Tax=Paraburkholderia xenovorans TaxID=36873 RepID=UPI0038BB628B
MPKITAAAKRPAALRHGTPTLVVATTVGNALEFFDFTAYSFFAIVIGKLFFPSLSPYLQLLTSVATYGIGYVARPLGGFFFGAYADKHGRKSALTATILLMATGCALIGLAPTYAQAGLLAPAIIVFARILQGFSAGGEVGTSTTVLVEHAQARHRGFFGSLQFASQGLGVVFGAALSLTLTACLSQAEIEQWGWRVPFLIGVAIAPLALVFRARLHEVPRAAVAPTGNAINEPSRHNPIAEIFSHHWRTLCAATLLIIGSTVCSNIITFYVPTYAISELHIAPSYAIAAALTSGITIVLASPLAGFLSDRFSRKTVVIWARISLILVLLPLFHWMSVSPSAARLLISVGVLSILMAMSTAPSITVVPEMFPKAVRATGMSIVYSVGVSIFGGFSLTAAVWLTHTFNSHLAAAYYTVACTAVSTIALLFIADRTGKALED